MIAEADTICFTGSVPTGRKVAVACAERLIPCYLELGGKDPCIVTATADLERAATAVLRGAVYATGQVCYSVERVYVHESVHDAFVEKLVEKAQAVRLNADNPRAGHIGPFTFAPQAEIVARHLADAVAKGATILTGGEVEDIGGGLYMRPTVLTGVDSRHADHAGRDVRPVHPGDGLCATPRKRSALANDTAFGLTASVIAGDVEEAKAIGRRINAGGVFLQDTFLTFAKMRHVRLGQLRLLGLRRPAHRAGEPAPLPAPQEPADPARAGRRHPGRSSPRAKPRMRITAAVSRAASPAPGASSSSSRKSRAPARCASAWSPPASATPTCTSTPAATRRSRSCSATKAPAWSRRWARACAGSRSAIT